MKREGGCLCGAVRIAVDGPIIGMLDCHCAACRKIAGGGPSHLVQVKEADFRVTKGAPKGYETLADSGAKVTRFFCADCGTPTHSLPSRFAGLCVLKAGVFDDDPGYAPEAAIWTGGAPVWSHIPDGLPRFERGSSD